MIDIIRKQLQEIEGRLQNLYGAQVFTLEVLTISQPPFPSDAEPKAAEVTPSLVRISDDLKQLQRAIEHLNIVQNVINDALASPHSGANKASHSERVPVLDEVMSYSTKGGY